MVVVAGPDRHSPHPAFLGVAGREGGKRESIMASRLKGKGRSPGGAGNGEGIQRLLYKQVWHPTRC